MAFGWKKLQDKWGFYKKEPGKLPEFVWRERSEYKGNNYVVMRNRGIVGNPIIVGYDKTRSDANKRMRKWMRKHPKS